MNIQKSLKGLTYSVGFRLLYEHYAEVRSATYSRVKTAHMLERPTKHDLKQYIILETNKPETHSYQTFNPNFKLIQVELILVLITVRTRKSIFCEFLFFAVNCLQLHGLQKNFFFMQICDHYIRILPIFQFWLCKSRLQSKLMVFTRVVYAQLGLTILVKLF